MNFIPKKSKMNPPTRTAKMNPIDPHKRIFPYTPKFPLLAFIASDSTIGICPLKKKLTRQKIINRDSKDQLKNNKVELKTAKQADKPISFFAKYGSPLISASHPQKGGAITLDHCIGDIKIPISEGENPLKFNHKPK